jgi:hypothetical protein
VGALRRIDEEVGELGRTACDVVAGVIDATVIDATVDPAMP